MDMSLSKLCETGKDREPWHAAIHGLTKGQTRLSDWKNNNNGDNGGKSESAVCVISSMYLAPI